jgi:hypothetical protein
LRRQHAFYPDFLDEDDALILKAITWKCPNGPVNFECGSFHKADGATSAEFRKAHEILIGRFNEEWQMVRLLPLWTLTMQTRWNVVMTRGAALNQPDRLYKRDELLAATTDTVLLYVLFCMDLLCKFVTCARSSARKRMGGSGSVEQRLLFFCVAP